jgi:hypothetical protein
MTNPFHPLLRELRWLNPGAHVHTLACLLMAEHGIEMDGRRVRAMLEQQKGPQVMGAGADHCRHSSTLPQQ